MRMLLYFHLFAGTDNATQSLQPQQVIPGQPTQIQMVAGQPQLQQQPGSVQFRQPLPPANLRPGMRLGSPGALVQVKYYGV